ncbi:heterogeneous nuclear ribonucleoprotein A3, putative, partial [Eimeria tenella]
VEVRRAIPREEARQTQPRRDRDPAENSGRVFIGGLGDDVTDEVLKDFFSRFGELTSANVMVDRETNRPRGFGFIIYKNPEDAEKALGIHKDLGPNAEAKRAQPRTQGPRMRMLAMGGPMGMPSPYRMEDPRYAVARTGYGGAGGAPAQLYGGYNYAYHPYYAAYYAQMAAAYGGGGYGGYSPEGSLGAERSSSRLPSSRSTPY